MDTILVGLIKSNHDAKLKEKFIEKLIVESLSIENVQAKNIKFNFESFFGGLERYFMDYENDMRDFSTYEQASSERLRVTNYTLNLLFTSSDRKHLETFAQHTNRDYFSALFSSLQSIQDPHRGENTLINLLLWVRVIVKHQLAFQRVDEAFVEAVCVFFNQSFVDSQEMISDNVLIIYEYANLMLEIRPLLDKTSDANFLKQLLHIFLRSICAGSKLDRLAKDSNKLIINFFKVFDRMFEVIDHLQAKSDEIFEYTIACLVEYLAKSDSHVITQRLYIAHLFKFLKIHRLSAVNSAVFLSGDKIELLKNVFRNLVTLLAWPFYDGLHFWIMQFMKLILSVGKPLFLIQVFEEKLNYVSFKNG